MSDDPHPMGVLLARLTELRYGAPGLRPERFKCRECLDEGMVATEEPNTLRPCSTCNRPSYDRWCEGAYEPSDKRNVPTRREPEDQSVRDQRRFGGRRTDEYA